MVTAAIPMMEHYRKLKRMYERAPINTAFYHPQISVGEGKAEIVMQVKPDFHHAAYAVHGSVYFKMLDDAAFFAAASLEQDVFVLTASFNTHFLRPVADGELRAVGSVIRHGKTLTLAESVLYDGNGKEIGRGNGNFARSTVSLSEKLGYGI